MGAGCALLAVIQFPAKFGREKPSSLSVARPDPSQRRRHPHQTISGSWDRDRCVLPEHPAPLLRKVRTVLTLVTICTWGLVAGRTKTGWLPPPESQRHRPATPCGGKPGRGWEKYAWGAGSRRTDLAGDVSKSPLSHSPSVFVFWDNYFRK